MSNIGLLQITHENLAGMLGLPKGHTVVAVVTPDVSNIANHTFTIVVSGPQLPEHAEGTFPPYVNMTRDSRGRISF